MEMNLFKTFSRTDVAIFRFLDIQTKMWLFNALKSRLQHIETNCNTHLIFSAIFKAQVV